VKKGESLLIGAAIGAIVAAVVMVAPGPTSLAAPLISGLLAALLGAIATDRRQSRQQAADDARHAAELAQERQLHELDALRDGLDKTWEIIHGALQRRTEAVWLWQQLPGAPSEEELARFEDADRLFGESVDATDHAVFQVSMRLDPGHAVLRALSHVHEELRAIYRTLEAGQTRTPARVAEIERRTEALKDALDRFRAESESLTGFQLPALDAGPSSPPALDSGRA
jgi:hypothetical protein